MMPLMSVLVLEIWGNMIYVVSVATLDGILRAVRRLSVVAAPVSEGRLLSSFAPHNFGV